MTRTSRAVAALSLLAGSLVGGAALAQPASAHWEQCKHGTHWSMDHKKYRAIVVKEYTNPRGQHVHVVRRHQHWFGVDGRTRDVVCPRH